MTGQDDASKPNPFAEREPSIHPQGPMAPDRARFPIYEMDAESCRTLDQVCIDEFGIPGIVLMENAGAVLCRHAIEMLEGISDPYVEIYCGPGNNAGDGLVLARHLSNHQIPTRVHLMVDDDQYTGDAGTNMRIVRELGLNAARFADQDEDQSAPKTDPASTLVVDAVFGTGITRAPQGVGASMIQSINAMRELGSLVLAVDVPSGFDAQHGRPFSPVVKATRTISMGVLKTGFSVLNAQRLLGRVVVEDIGIPIQVIERFGTRVRSPREPTPEL